MQKMNWLMNQMRAFCQRHNVAIKFEGENWQFDNVNDCVIAPKKWWIEDDTDKLWREVVLKPYINGYKQEAELLKIPQFVFNVYHEVGHGMTEPSYETTNLRHILDGLAQISKEISLRGYFELPDEVDATEWAIDEIEMLVSSGAPRWWNEKDLRNFEKRA